MDSPSRQTKERSIASLLKTFFHNFLNEQIVRRLGSDFTVELHSRGIANRARFCETPNF